MRVDSPVGLPGPPRILEVGSTMRNCITLGASLAVALLAGSVLAADPIKSGLQEGQKLPAFDTLHCNGPQTGAKACLV